jgi:hypothetical protein
VLILQPLSPFAEQDVIADIVFHEPVSIGGCESRVHQVHVFDDGLEFPAVLPGDLPAEDHRDFVRLTDGSIGVQQPFSHPIQSGTAAEDQAIAESDLCKEQAMLATELIANLLNDSIYEHENLELSAVVETKHRRPELHPAAVCM